MKRKLLFLGLFFGCALVLRSQKVIPILNGDFENGEIGQGFLPENWIDFGDLSRTPPDLHGVNSLFFGCTKLPFSGRKYVGMVTRTDFTAESIGQKLVSPMKMGHIYKFSLQIAAAENYQSKDVQMRELVNFDAPVVLRIWGCKSKKSTKKVLLTETTAIQSCDWKLVEFTLKITEFDCKWIVLQAWFPPENQPKNGNILIDNLSNLTQVE